MSLPFGWSWTAPGTGVKDGEGGTVDEEEVEELEDEEEPDEMVEEGEATNLTVQTWLVLPSAHSQT